MLIGLFESFLRMAIGLIALVLAIFAIFLAIYGIGQAVYAVMHWYDVRNAVLTGVGFAIISIAVFEVSKYLLEEEVVRGREMRAPAEARRSLTKFIATASIVVFLEALVSIFSVGHTNVAELVYPAALLLTATLMVLGLGIFLRLSAAVEQQVSDHDES